MNRGDQIRQMNNAELSNEIMRWHEILFGNEFRFAEDIEHFLDQELEEELEIIPKRKAKSTSNPFAWNDAIAKMYGTEREE